MQDRTLSKLRRSPHLACLLTLAAFTLLAGCKQGTNAADSAVVTGPDPTDANLAPVGQPVPQPADQVAHPRPQPAPASARQLAPRTRVLGQTQQAYPSQQSESYPPSAPIERRAPDPDNYVPPATQYADNQQYDNQQYASDASAEYVEAEAPQPPPPLPVYEQPPAPEPNVLWTPGYWSYAPTGYFWVPGTWCRAPYSGALWTPGYWDGDGPRYRFHHGFWGLHIGFYGGINYGFGYFGSGYRGGYWRGNDFYYNRSVNRVNETVIHNTYIRNVTINNTIVNNRVSYNGGRGGIQVRPAAYEIAAMREPHTAPLAAQQQLRQESQTNRNQFFSVNNGRPAAVVSPRPLPAEHVPAPHLRPAVNQTQQVIGAGNQTEGQRNVLLQQGQASQLQQQHGVQPGPQRTGQLEPHINQPNRPGVIPPQSGRIPGLQQQERDGTLLQHQAIQPNQQQLDQRRNDQLQQQRNSQLQQQRSQQAPAQRSTMQPDTQQRLEQQQKSDQRRTDQLQQGQRSQQLQQQQLDQRRNDQLQQQRLQQQQQREQPGAQPQPQPLRQPHLDQPRPQPQAQPQARPEQPHAQMQPEARPEQPHAELHSTHDGHR